jgi:hypothetical protein
MKRRTVVRVVGANSESVVAFITLPSTTDEVRVRFRRSSTRCDSCGRQDAPTCPHARAVAALGIDLPRRYGANPL